MVGVESYKLANDTRTVLITALVSIAGTVAIGLYLNQQVSGSFFGNTPILWTGIIGTFLALGYREIRPIRI